MASPLSSAGVSTLGGRGVVDINIPEGAGVLDEEDEVRSTRETDRHAPVHACMLHQAAFLSLLLHIDAGKEERRGGGGGGLVHNSVAVIYNRLIDHLHSGNMLRRSVWPVVCSLCTPGEPPF